MDQHAYLWGRTASSSSLMISSHRPLRSLPMLETRGGGLVFGSRGLPSLSWLWVVSSSSLSTSRLAVPDDLDATLFLYLRKKLCGW